jgi:hypothetical protein
VDEPDDAFFTGGHGFGAFIFEIIERFVHINGFFLVKNKI